MTTGDPVADDDSVYDVYAAVVSEHFTDILFRWNAGGNNCWIVQR